MHISASTVPNHSVSITPQYFCFFPLTFSCHHFWPRGSTATPCVFNQQSTTVILIDSQSAATWQAWANKIGAEFLIEIPHGHSRVWPSGSRKRLICLLYKWKYKLEKEKWQRRSAPHVKSGETHWRRTTQGQMSVGGWSRLCWHFQWHLENIQEKQKETGDCKKKLFAEQKTYVSKYEVKFTQSMQKFENNSHMKGVLTFQNSLFFYILFFVFVFFKKGKLNSYWSQLEKFYPTPTYTTTLQSNIISSNTKRMIAIIYI